MGCHGHSWAVKTTTQLEKPRYVIFASQTGRKNVMSRDVSVFDDWVRCNLSNVKVYINSYIYSSIYSYIFKFRILSVRRFKSGFWQKKICHVWYIHIFVKNIIESTASKRCSMWSHLSRKGLLQLLIVRDKMNPSRDILVVKFYANVHCGRCRIWLQEERVRQYYRLCLLTIASSYTIV